MPEADHPRGPRTPLLSAEAALKPGLPPKAMVAVGLVALVSLLLEHGFALRPTSVLWLDWLDVALAVCFGLDLVLPLFTGENWRDTLHSQRFEYLVLVVFVVSLEAASWVLPRETLQELLRALHLKSIAKLYFGAIQIFLLLNLLIRLLRAQQRILATGVRPELLLAGSFGLLIVCGTLLLLPNASAKPDNQLSLVDAVFTSTSACCVTGLAVRDTGTDFSTFGQMVIMALFQIGGLGIITFVAFVSVFSARSRPLPEMVAIREIVSARGLSDVRRQILSILVVTALVEGAGALSLYLFLPSGTEPLARLKWSVFHAVSAFCNAGFSLQADSLITHRGNWGLMLTFIALILFGGLGFIVLRDLTAFRATTLPMFRAGRFFRRHHAGRPASRLSVQTRISLAVTAGLLAAGFFGFWALEAGHALGGKTLGEQILTSAFHSVTPRTAGFNCVPIDGLQDATLILTMALMVVGACPVSTGGGIKTVTFGVLLLALRSMLNGSERVEAFGRTLPRRALFAALSVFVIYVLAAVSATFLLAITDPDRTLQDQAFEVVSALSTVGLSTGITPHLSSAGKLILCFTMFVGRVGPLSLVVSVFRSSAGQHYEYPEEEVVVG